MDTPRGRKAASLIEELLDAPYRFEFFQAVRLLETLSVSRAVENDSFPVVPVGFDGPTDDEAVRFRASPMLTFPASEISTLEQTSTDPTEGQPATRCEMSVNFLGLTGPSGAMPRHYTSLVIERCHPRYKDRTLRDFLDLFNHRSISLFYRAWEKYRLPPAYERHHRQPSHGERPSEDPITAMLFALVGLGTTGMRRRLQFDDKTILFYAGLFANRIRCAVNLQQMLSDFFGMPAAIWQFRGQWLYLNSQEQSSFPTATCREGRHLALGESAVAGSKVWDVRAKFRVRLGPLSFRQFSQFLPNGDRFVPLCQLVRLYVGAELDYDVQLVLTASEVPWCSFTNDPASGPHLGWNTWIRSKEFTADVDDPVFVPTGF
jgi:type VI secretion system protein ImpH